MTSHKNFNTFIEFTYGEEGSKGYIHLCCFEGIFCELSKWFFQSHHIEYHKKRRIILSLFEAIYGKLGQPLFETLVAQNFEFIFIFWFL